MKKNKQNAETDSDQTYQVIEKEIDQLADVLCVKHKSEKVTENDPFSEYMETVQAKFHADPRHFKSRLAKGYHALLQQLHEDNPSDLNKSI